MDSSRFQNAIKTYLEEYKPDPLTKRQIQDLHVEWKDRESAELEEKDGQEGDWMEPISSSTPTQYSTRGELELASEYMTVKLDVTSAWWRNSPGGTSTATSEEASPCSTLWFRMSVQGLKFLRNSERKKRNQTSHDDKNEKRDRKQDRMEAKIRANMVSRLGSDTYIKQLLQSLEQQRPVTLCVALIQSSDNNRLEERVNVEDDVAEGVRRSILSQCDGTVVLMEFLLSMPYLHDPSGSTNTEVARLAQRAKLRLLEDAMLDACEKEGEDELLDDLNISERPDEQDSEDGKDTTQNAIKRHKP